MYDDLGVVLNPDSQETSIEIEKMPTTTIGEPDEYNKNCESGNCLWSF